MKVNIPYKKEYNTDGTVKDVFPYDSGISNRQIRRGNERIIPDSFGNPIRQRRVKSQKRKRNWV